MAPARSVPRLLTWICGLALPIAAAGADWPQWRGPNRTGAATLAEGVAIRTEAPADGLRPAWSVALPDGPGGGWASPIVADGRVFLAVAGRVKKEGVELPPAQYPRLTDEQEAALPAAEAEAYTTKQRAESLERRRAAFTGREAIHCLDAATGDLLWTNQRDTPVTRFPQSSTPAVMSDGTGGGRLVCLSGDRVLRCLNATTGETVWEITLPGEFDAEQISSSPLIETGPDGGGRVHVQAGALFCVDLTDGAVLWENEAAAGRDSSPAVWYGPGGAAVVVNATGGETVGVNPADGTELWRLEETGASRSSPVVAETPDGDRLLTFGSSRKGGLRCYDLTTNPPSPLWKYQKTADPGASPVVVGGLVLVPGDRRLDCVNLETGAGLWTARLDLAKPRYTSPAALLSAGSNDGGGVGLYTFGRLLAFDLTGEEYRPRFDLSVGPDGLAKTEDRWREELAIPAGTPEGVARFDKEVTRVGLLDCASPAVAGGRVYVRLRNRLACYDLAE